MLAGCRTGMSWQKGLVQQSCLVPGSWEAGQGTVPERRGQGPDRDSEVLTFALRLSRNVLS